ncbi:MAG: hypothetical protein IT210_11890 [Armatimonadetes bacterium]|nr:hypothetical protein [Armatimonadota bacterium]
MPNPGKKTYINLYVRDTEEMQMIADALAVIAKAQRRPVTHLLEDILREALKEQQPLMQALRDVHARYSAQAAPEQEPAED